MEGSSGDETAAEGFRRLGLRILKLPLDIQLPIFRFLPRATLQMMLTEAPRLFDVLTLDRRLWNAIELNGMELRTGRACKLLAKAPHYTRLVISNRCDLNKLIKILLKCQRREHLTYISFTDCYGSESPLRPFVKGFLVYQLIKSCPSLNSFELKVQHIKSLLLFQHLGNNCVNFSFIACCATKPEVLQFLRCCPAASLVLMDDETVQGDDVVTHVTERFADYGSFTLDAVRDKFRIGFTEREPPTAVLGGFP